MSIDDSDMFQVAVDNKKECDRLRTEVKELRFLLKESLGFRSDAHIEKVKEITGWNDETKKLLGDAK